MHSLLSLGELLRRCLLLCEHPDRRLGRQRFLEVRCLSESLSGRFCVAAAEDTTIMFTSNKPPPPSAPRMWAHASVTKGIRVHELELQSS